MSTLADPMLALWKEVARKDEDGTPCLVWKDQNDVDILYHTGFVDETKFTLQHWRDAHEDYRQKDGSYKLLLHQWLNLRKFRYEGSVSVPFDPEALKEGAWTESQFDRFLKESFLPSVTVTEGQFRTALKTTGNKIYDKGTYKITRSFKNDLKTILDTYPSSRRLREIGVYIHRELDKRKPNSPKVSQKSTFTKGPSEASVITNKLSQILNR